MRKLGVAVAVGVIAAFLTGASRAVGTRPGAAPILSGVLLDANRTPTRGRAWVFADVPGLRLGGGAVRPPLIATGTVDAQGRFSIAVPKPVFDLNRYGASPALVQRVQRGIRRNRGWANLDLVVSDGNVTRLIGLSRRPEIAAHGQARFVGGRGTLNVGRVLLKNTGPGVVPVTGNGGPAACVETVEALGAPFAKETVVGELHAAGDSTETFTFGRAADSEIDVGVSSDGGHTWAADGSFHIANTVGQSVQWPSRTMNRKHLVTAFQYQRKRHRFAGPGCGARRSVDTVEATSWLGGADTSSRAFDPSHGCSRTPYSLQRVPYGRRGHWERHTERAVRYGAAVTLFGVLHLGASSGYSQSVSLDFTAGSKHAHYFVCGDDAFPAKSSRVFTGFTDKP